MRSKAQVQIVKELHSNFCGGCRLWIVSEEVVAVFSMVDGVRQKVFVWKCPTCRGDTPEGEVDIVRAPVTAADLSQDDHRGPFRDIVPGTYVANPGGITGRVQLVCGHSATVFAKAKHRWRCTKCRAKKAKAS
jgi:Zn finger protein HypA/HybF involved in hydrogenase expression